MAKKVTVTVKLQAPAQNAMGNSNLAAILGQKKINIKDFTTRFNEQSKKIPQGKNCGIIVKVAPDNKTNIIVRGPSAVELIKGALGIEKGSGKAGLENISKTLSFSQLRKLAEEQKKYNDDPRPVESIMNCLKGTAKSMGVVVKGE